MLQKIVIKYIMKNMNVLEMSNAKYVKKTDNVFYSSNLFEVPLLNHNIHCIYIYIK